MPIAPKSPFRNTAKPTFGRFVRPPMAEEGRESVANGGDISSRDGDAASFESDSKISLGASCERTTRLTGINEQVSPT